MLQAAIEAAMGGRSVVVIGASSEQCERLTQQTWDMLQTRETPRVFNNRIARAIVIEGTGAIWFRPSNHPHFDQTSGTMRHFPRDTVTFEDHYSMQTRHHILRSDAQVYEDIVNPLPPPSGPLPRPEA